MSIMVHVGLDVHEGTIRVLGLPDDINIDKPVIDTQLINQTATLQRNFARWAKQYQLRCCYEASSCGYALYRLLTRMGIACEVIAPSLIPTRQGDHVKTDRRDARNLARLYRINELVPVHIPTEAEEADRGLLRLREALVGEVVESKNEIHKFLRAHGIKFDGKSNWTQSHWAWLRKLSFTGVDAIVWGEYVGLLDYKISRLQEIDRAVIEMAHSHRYAKDVARLCCLRGFREITAMVLITEIRDFRRFSNPRALMSYLGLTPKEHSSGARQRQGGITKAGNARCRRVVMESAWKYIHKPAVSTALKSRQAGQPGDLVAHCWKAQQRLYKKYWGIANRKGPQKAVVAAGRELVGFIWAIMTQYRPLEQAAIQAAG